MTPGQPVLVRMSAEIERPGIVESGFVIDGQRMWRVRATDKRGNGGALLTVPERVVTPIRA